MTLLVAALVGACNLQHGDGVLGTEAPGDFGDKPDGDGSFFADPHSGGGGSRLHLVEMAWGRLVDVHDVSPTGERSPHPLLRDFVVRETLVSDGANYVMESDPITQKVRLVVQRTKGAPDMGDGTFEDLLRDTFAGLPMIDPKHDDGTSVGPFSFVARNSVLVLRFDDLLDDGPTAEQELLQTVRVVTGYPPVLPFAARLRFDRNFGGVVDGRFHSTRVLIDTTISTVEMADLGAPLPGNMRGLPASSLGMDGGNVSVRIPTRTDVGSGQFVVLTGLKGALLDPHGNGPVDLDSPTVDVVRAMRSGNDEDLFRGYLYDEVEPTLLGEWPIAVDVAYDDPSGRPGFDFVLDVAFPTPCRAAPILGDVLQAGQYFLTVAAPGAEPDEVTGVVRDVHCGLVGESPVPSTAALLGDGQFHRAFSPDSTLDLACWVKFTPPAKEFPARGVSPDAKAVLRFSEPMNPDAVRPYDSMLLIRGDSSQAPTASNITVGSLVASIELTEYTFNPLLPLDHQFGNEEPNHLLLLGGVDGATDLAGNPLAVDLPPVDFTLDASQPTRETGGIVLRFNEMDEFDPFGDPSGTTPELRGQFTYDLERGVIQPRGVARQSWPADDSNPVPSQMFQLPLGFGEPLNPLGSKLQTLWRTADLGWDVRDETLYDIDVEGLNWMPFGGITIGDYFESFEIKLAHARQLPDEDVDLNGALLYPNSGLLDAPNFFEDNVLGDPRSPLTTVHSRGLGFLIDPTESFLASSGHIMMPLPLNRAGGPATTYTWRDTTVLAKGGENSAGIPQSIEMSQGLYPGLSKGSIAGPGAVPSFGLPLLMQYSCFPSNTGLGLNVFRLAVARKGQVQPSFRVHSTGGYDVGANKVLVFPDLEQVPAGGFDPTSTPPGAPTRSADPTLYFGQLDTVVRLSRAHSIWFPTNASDPDFVLAAMEPSPAELPVGTEIRLEYRGAGGFTGADDTPFDAGTLDAYGDLTSGSVNFWRGVDTWTADLDELDGAPYLQVRLTFVNNIETGQHPELSSLALAFEK